MFLVKDTLPERQEKIRSFLKLEPAIAVILAAADFEWTVRRAILALGCSPTPEIRQRWKDKHLSGPDAYKDEWKKEVKPRTHSDLARVVPDWRAFKGTAYRLRHELVHGSSGTAGVVYASRAVTTILKGTKAVADHAELHGAPVYGRVIRRDKARS